MIPASLTAIRATSPAGGRVPAPAWVAGQVLDARVLAALEAGMVRLSIAGIVIEALATSPLPVGSTVRFAVDADGQTLRLVPPDTPATPRGAAPAQQHSQPAPPAAPADTVPRAAALARAVEAAVARQGGLAQLFADLGQASRTPHLALPPKVRDAIEQVLGFRIPLEAEVSPQTIRDGFLRSGLFREALLAAVGAGNDDAPGSGPRMATAPAGDLARFDTAAMRAALAAGPATGTLPGQPAGDLKSALLVLKSALMAMLGDSEAPAVATAGAPEGSARPPRAADPPTAQAPVAPSPADAAPPREIARALLAETDAALARTVLHQLASADGAATPVRAEASGPTYLFELPMLSQGGTGIAQFAIEGDDKGRGAEAAAVTWQVRFAIDVEPLGPVHAHLRLSGDRLAVTLWAERADTRARLAAATSDFESAVASADLALDQLRVQDGRPLGPGPDARHFLDRRS